MKTEQELKDQCTPEFIKWMCEMAEGFEPSIDTCFKVHGKVDCYTDSMLFALLVYRAVEGWNNKSGADSIVVYGDRVESCIDFNLIEYISIDYQSQSLTQSECAMLDCLLDIFEGGRE